MIFINSKIFYTIIVVLLISFSFFTFFYIEKGNYGSKDVKKEIKIESTVMSENGYFNTRTVKGLSPGKYIISVKPIGNNVTVWFRSYHDSVRRLFKESNGELTVKIKVDSVVWQGILIGDAPDFNFSDKQSTMKITYNKINDGWEVSTWLLLGVGITGGVIFAANEARIYRKKRE